MALSSEALYDRGNTSSFLDVVYDSNAYWYGGENANNTNQA